MKKAVYGRTKNCPNCGMHNRSGVKLPENCQWCKGKKKETKSDIYDDVIRIQYNLTSI